MGTDICAGPEWLLVFCHPNDALPDQSHCAAAAFDFRDLSVHIRDLQRATEALGIDSLSQRSRAITAGSGGTTAAGAPAATT